MRNVFGIMARTAAAAVLSLAVATGAMAADPLAINGAGATFPYPLYSKWFYDYSNANPGVRFNYQSIGSGGGIKQITEGTVDFGASDAPMKDADMARMPGPVFHLPTAMGAVSVVYNLEGVASGLRFTPEVLVDIYLGKIRKWNDPKIAVLNKGAKLPATDIIVAHRSDGSGTTSIFTGYLSAVSPEWKSRVGSGTSVNWPVGLGGKGNEGVSGVVKQTPAGIGYVELAYAKQNHMTYALLRNRDGHFVAPTLEATSAAAAGAAKTMPADYRVSIVNAPGKNSYPIAGFTWLLVYKNQTNEAKGKALVQFLKWAFTDGQKMEAALDYARLPKPVVDMLQKTLRQINYKGKSLY